MSDVGLYLGIELDSGERLLLDTDHLTTHAVCLGMTGSGKTGLGIVALEELARRGVPLLVIDLKGDMVNLLLGFPSLSGEDFEPWLPADAVIGQDRQAVAREQAARWRRGLEGSGLGPEDVRAVRDGLAWQLLTPGIASVAPLDILPALSVPEGWDPDRDVDATSERLNGVTSALLSLIGRGGDPLTDRDHVLVASVILECWRRGEALDLVGLLKRIAEPPMDALGALPLESFYPRDDRMGLVMALNTLLASPAFAAWTRGTPLLVEELLGTAASPRGTIVSIAHLDQRQRLFILGLLVSELVGWMRGQPASSGLRALLYVDEVQGILPPHPANPPTKGPLLTLLKQGRAFGVGAWLATQNPVDLDYKALGNAGVKILGRLITERDRERALEGLDVAGAEVEQLVTSLDKRQFALHDVRAGSRLRTFSSRWAMSYLRGPVTIAEMGPLVVAQARELEAVAPARPEPGATVAAPGDTSPPLLATELQVRFVAAGEGIAEAMLLVRNRVTLERRTLGLYRREEEVWRVSVDDQGKLDWGGPERLEIAPDLAHQAPPGMRFPATAPSRLEDELGRAGPAFIAWRSRQPVTVLANRKLKLVAEPGESAEAFRERCLEAADRADDSEQERIRARFERRMTTLRNRLERERDELEHDQAQLQSRRAEEKLGVVEGLFSVFLGSKSIRSAASKAASKARGAASKRRMRQRAESSVVESEREIERLEADLEDLADELQDEVDRVAVESEAKAEAIEEVAVPPTRAQIEVVEMMLVWDV